MVSQNSLELTIYNEINYVIETSNRKCIKWLLFDLVNQIISRKLSGIGGRCLDVLKLHFTIGIPYILEKTASYKTKCSSRINIGTTYISYVSFHEYNNCFKFVIINVYTV